MDFTTVVSTYSSYTPYTFLKYCVVFVASSQVPAAPQISLNRKQ